MQKNNDLTITKIAKFITKKKGKSNKKFCA